MSHGPHRLSITGLFPSLCDRGTSSERNEYGAYLGVFFLLTIMVAGLCIVELWRIRRSDGPATFGYLCLAFAAVTIAITGALAPERYPGGGSEASVTPLGVKKAGLATAFTAYVVALFFLALWAGRYVQAYSGLLTLTASVSIYVAKTRRMRVFIGMLAVVAYAVSSIWNCEGPDRIVTANWSYETLMNIVVTIAIVIISAIASRYAGAQRAGQ